jgi:hypothetical protein
MSDISQFTTEDIVNLVNQEIEYYKLPLKARSSGEAVVFDMSGEDIGAWDISKLTNILYGKVMLFALFGIKELEYGNHSLAEAVDDACKKNNEPKKARELPSYLRVIK